MAWYDRLLNLGRTSRLNREIEREQAFHMEETAEALRAAGWSPEAAEREARRRFGNPTYQREATRDADVVVWLDSLLRDLRHAFRGLVRSPLFATVAVLSLALGIGANTAVFSLIEALVLRPLPVHAPDELVAVALEGESGFSSALSNPIWEQIRERQTGMSTVAAFAERRFSMGTGVEGRPVNGAYVSGDYFRLFGVGAAAGRVLGPGDDIRGCPPTAVLSHRFWSTQHGEDPSVVGSRVTVEGLSFEVLGIAAPGFESPEVGRPTDLYVPLCAEALVRGSRSALDRGNTWWLRVMGRRDEGVTVDQLGVRLATISPGVFGATIPETYGVEQRARYEENVLTANAASTGLSGLRGMYAEALYILMAGVALVLLIACANVANLLLARATTRERELAIRSAIGAGRGRLRRQMITEAVLLAALGAAVGLAVARIAAGGLVALIARQGQPLSLDLSLNGSVLLFTTGVAVLTVLTFGLVPAWRAGRVDPQRTMSSHGRGIAGGRQALGKALVAGQVAVSLVLLAGAGLFVGSLRNLVTIDPGFTAEGVLIADVDLSSAGMSDDAVQVALQEIEERLASLPGARSASRSFLTPVSFSRWNESVVVEGHEAATLKEGTAWFNEVSPGYFETMDTRLLAGRDFDRTDVAGGPLVTVVNESVAEEFFGGDPVGKVLRTRSGDDLSEPYTVVGVVEDAKYESLREEESGTVFLAAAQSSGGPPFATFEIRTDGVPGTLFPAVRRAVAEAIPAARLELGTLSDQLAESVQRERLLAILSGTFAAVALALAVLGLYGIMAYSVARRRSEIGVRMALGADRGRVLRLVLRDTALVLAAGLAIGFWGSLATGRFVEGFLFGLAPGDPRVLGGAGALLALTALAAGTIPALRAARMDPTAALRED